MNIILMIYMYLLNNIAIFAQKVDTVYCVKKKVDTVYNTFNVSVDLIGKRRKKSRKLYYNKYMVLLLISRFVSKIHFSFSNLFHKILNYNMIVIRK
jgi:hypothetical protein